MPSTWVCGVLLAVVGCVGAAVAPHTIPYGTVWHPHRAGLHQVAEIARGLQKDQQVYGAGFVQTDSNATASNSTHNSTSNSFCSSRVNATMSSLLIHPDCSELVIKIIPTDNERKMCNSTCWATFVHEMEELSRAGCLPHVHAKTLGVVCKTPTNTTKTPEVQPTPAPANNTTPPQPHHTVSCPNNCSSHGSCVTVNGDKFCECNKGYGWQGIFDIAHADANEDCSEYTLSQCPEECNGHGVCVKNDGNKSCVCYPGFSGATCSTWDGCKELDFCSGHGRCSHSTTEPDHCECALGFTGSRCQIERIGCPNNCGGHGICTLENNHQRCECDAHYSGESCSISSLVCPAMCSGLGLCENGTCACIDGFSGDSCSTVTDPCHGCARGYCRHGTCECMQGFEGAHCDKYNRELDTQCSKLNFCSGYGICQQTNGTNFACVCFEGFGGAMCSKVDSIDAHPCTNYCSGHGRCKLASVPYCECNDGWYGRDCSLPKCPAGANGRVCSGHGVCEFNKASDQYRCTCDEGFELHNKTCQSMCPNECSNHGKCTTNATCLCDGGFAGTDCSQQIATARLAFAQTAPQQQSLDKRDDEEEGDIVDASMCANSCSHRGECVMGACKCKTGYSGTDCSEENASLFEETGGVDLLEIHSDQHSAGMARLWD